MFLLSHLSPLIFNTHLFRVQEGRESDKRGDHERRGLQLPPQTGRGVHRNHMRTRTYIPSALITSHLT